MRVLLALHVPMKQTTVGFFEQRDSAEKAVRMVHRRLSVPTDDITFLYRNDDGKLREVDVDVTEGTGTGTGVWTGVIVGLLVGEMFGVAVVAGLVPAVEALFSTGGIARLLANLGISTTAGTISLSALSGALLG